LGQAFLQQTDPAALAQESPEPRRAGTRAELLVGKLDLDGLAGAFEFNGAGHRLVNRACARGWRGTHSPPISSRSVALFQLHGYGLDKA
jgi:hypothetical protein